MTSPCTLLIAVIIPAILYLITFTTAAPFLPSHPNSPKATDDCRGSLHLTAADLNVTKCEIITGSIWLEAAGIESIVRIDNGNYKVINGERSVLLHGSVFVYNNTKLNQIPPAGNGSVQVRGSDRIAGALNSTVPKHGIAPGGAFSSKTLGLTATSDTLSAGENIEDIQVSAANVASDTECRSSIDSTSTPGDLGIGNQLSSSRLPVAAQSSSAGLSLPVAQPDSTTAAGGTPAHALVTQESSTSSDSKDSDMTSEVHEGIASGHIENASEITSSTEDQPAASDTMSAGKPPERVFVMTDSTVTSSATPVCSADLLGHSGDTGSEHHSWPKQSPLASSLSDFEAYSPGPYLDIAIAVADFTSHNTPSNYQDCPKTQPTVDSPQSLITAVSVATYSPLVDSLGTSGDVGAKEQTGSSQLFLASRTTTTQSPLYSSGYQSMTTETDFSTYHTASRAHLGSESKSLVESNNDIAVATLLPQSAATAFEKDRSPSMSPMRITTIGRGTMTISPEPSPLPASSGWQTSPRVSSPAVATSNSTNTTSTQTSQSLSASSFGTSASSVPVSDDRAANIPPSPINREIKQNQTSPPASLESLPVNNGTLTALPQPSPLQTLSRSVTSLSTSSQSPAAASSRTTPIQSLQPLLSGSNDVSTTSVTSPSEEAIFDFDIKMMPSLPFSPSNPARSQRSSRLSAYFLPTHTPCSSNKTERSSLLPSLTTTTRHLSTAASTDSTTSIQASQSYADNSTWTLMPSTRPSGNPVVEYGIKTVPFSPSGPWISISSRSSFAAFSSLTEPSSSSHLTEPISATPSFVAQPPHFSNSTSVKTPEATPSLHLSPQSNPSTEDPEPMFVAASGPPPPLGWKPSPGRMSISGWKPISGGRPQPERRPPTTKKPPLQLSEDPPEPLKLKAASACGTSNKCTDCRVAIPTSPAQQLQNADSISVAKTLPSLPTPKLLPGSLGWTRTVPREYEFLTLDGKITYARANGEHVFDSVLHYADGRPAAVGPGNRPLEEGFVLNELGRVISYRGTTVEEVREMRREAEAGLKAERKKKFQTLRKKFDNMEQRSRATLREERKLTGGERAAKKVAGEVAKVRG